MTEAYPLTWPAGWPRTRNPGKSQFKTSLNGAVANVQDSLRRFSADSGKKIDGLIVSSNASLMDSKPADPGVAVYFTWDGISTCIAVDRYQSLAENLQAIHHVIEAERTKLRHGGLNLVRQAFRGYAALPPPSGASAGREWADVLCCSRGAELPAIEAHYRMLAKKRQGDHDKMVELNAAIAQARAEKGGTA